MREELDVKSIKPQSASVIFVAVKCTRRQYADAQDSMDNSLPLGSDRAEQAYFSAERPRPIKISLQEIHGAWRRKSVDFDASEACDWSLLELHSSHLFAVCIRADYVKGSMMGNNWIAISMSVFIPASTTFLLTPTMVLRTRM